MSTTSDLKELKGRIVLVRSTRDRRNPPTAMRGWIEVHETGTAPKVSVAIEFPQMFMIPAHHRVIPLDQAGLARLLATEQEGVFEFTIDEELA